MESARPAKVTGLHAIINIHNDIDIYPVHKKVKAVILTQGYKDEFELQPIIRKKAVQLKTPDIDDQRDDLKRVLSYNDEKYDRLELRHIRRLPKILRANDYLATYIYSKDTLIGIESGDQTKTLYGVALDIGTTTIAGYLFNLNTGEENAVYSCMNPQKRFGADVYIPNSLRKRGI